MKPIIKLYTKDELSDPDFHLTPEQVEIVLAAQEALNPLGMQYDPDWDDQPSFGMPSDYKPGGLRMWFLGCIRLSTIELTPVEELPFLAVSRIAERCVEEGRESAQKSMRDALGITADYMRSTLGIRNTEDEE